MALANAEGPKTMSLAPAVSGHKLSGQPPPAASEPAGQFLSRPRQGLSARPDSDAGGLSDREPGFPDSPARTEGS